MSKMPDLATRIRSRIAHEPECARMHDPDLWALLEDAAAELEAVRAITEAVNRACPAKGG